MPFHLVKYPPALPSASCYCVLSDSASPPNYTNLVFSHLFICRFPPGHQLSPLSISAAPFSLPASSRNGTMAMGHGAAAGGPHRRAGTELPLLLASRSQLPPRRAQQQTLAVGASRELSASDCSLGAQEGAEGPGYPCSHGLSHGETRVSVISSPGFAG